jgi:hypothetical protein
MDFPKLTEEEERIGKAIVQSAFLVHRELGPVYLKKFMRFVSLMN